MSDSTIETKRIVETEEGVSVEVRARRGTDTRDDDSVSVEAHYGSLEGAREGSVVQSSIVRERMAELRALGTDGEMA